MLCCPTTHTLPKNGGKEISSHTYLSNSDLSTFSFQTNHPQRSLEITTEESSPELGYTEKLQDSVDGSMRRRRRKPLQVRLHDSYLPIQAEVHKNFGPNCTQKLLLDIRRYNFSRLVIFLFVIAFITNIYVGWQLAREEVVPVSSLSLPSRSSVGSECSSV